MGKGQNSTPVGMAKSTLSDTGGDGGGGTPTGKAAYSSEATQLNRKTPWWRGAVIYQIYPRSFCDTNGDGVGDLAGITQKLSHVASLGVDAIWLSPFFTSPMDDFGYDVADFCDVDPLFGTLEDFDRLIDKAHALDLKVIIDQVYSHTSDQHSWFKQSRQSQDNAKADWYVWADPKPDGSPPNNWQSVFGGPAWEWDSRRRQYYLHNFLTSQPDLNVHNPAVQDAVLDVARFWLERGVDGFRLDALNFAMHDPEFRDNPPARVFKRPPTRPVDFQEHKHNQSHPDIPKFLERIGAVAAEYQDRFTVAEVGGPNPLGEMKAFTEGDDRLHSAYNFDYLYAEDLTPARVVASADAWSGTPGEGWPSWAFSNHDAPRAVSRWGDEANTDPYAKLHAMLLLSLRGNAFIYQGEELGLVQGHVPFEALQDPEAIKNWPETLGRDGARTPMPWTTQAPFAGFSTAKPWLPVDPRHVTASVVAQEGQDASVLSFFKEAIRMRKEQDALAQGDFTLQQADDSGLYFTRSWQGTDIHCIYNLGAEEIDLPSWGSGKTLLLSNREELKTAEGLGTLPPFTGLWLK